MIKTDIERLFSVGDALPCRDGSGALSIAAILEDRVLLRPANPDAGGISLEYGAISAALASSGAEKDAPPMDCFISEYRKRTQARHEELVDALWDSAAELFLGPVCIMPEPQGMGNIPACPLDASFFLKR